MNEKDETIDVSDDHILLQQVTQDHEVTAKQLAMLTGKAASTVYKYLAGGTTIPSVVWRQLYKKTTDHRIIQLITGDVMVAIVPLVEVAVKVDAATLSKLIETRKRQLECEGYVLKILADGRIDESDRVAIRKYKKGFMDMVVSQSQIFQAITGQYDIVTSRRAAK